MDSPRVQPTADIDDGATLALVAVGAVLTQDVPGFALVAGRPHGKWAGSGVPEPA